MANTDNSTAGQPRLRRVVPSQWEVYVKKGSNGVDELAVGPEGGQLPAVFIVTCADIGESLLVECLMLADYVVNKIGGLIVSAVKSDEPSGRVFSLKYVVGIETGSQALGGGAVKADSGGRGKKLIITGVWPRALDAAMSEIFDKFVKSVDYC